MTYKEDNELSNFLTKSQITGFLLLKKKKKKMSPREPGAWQQEIQSSQQPSLQALYLGLHDPD